MRRQDAVVGRDIVELLIGDAQEALVAHGQADGLQEVAAARDADGLDAGAQVLEGLQEVVLQNVRHHLLGKAGRHTLRVAQAVFEVGGAKMHGGDVEAEGLAEGVEIFVEAATVVKDSLALALEHFVDLLAPDALRMVELHLKNQSVGVGEFH